jgi:hypothetical protein
MKNLIYQCWDGDIPAQTRASVANMSIYAKRIGAEHLFEDNPRFVTDLGYPTNHLYGSLKPIFDDKFLEYDNVLYVDTDIFTVSKLGVSIFDDFDSDVGICTEPFQPEYRNSEDNDWICGRLDEQWAGVVKEQWGCDIPRTSGGLPKVYNSGLTLWSNNGLRHARATFRPFREYVTLIKRSGLSRFYLLDQNYLHAMLCMSDMNYTELSNDWNAIVHFYRVGDNGNLVHDPRTPDTKFVHVMLTGGSKLGPLMQWRIVNMPKSVWQYAPERPSTNTDRNSHD